MRTSSETAPGLKSTNWSTLAQRCTQIDWASTEVTMSSEQGQDTVVVYDIMRETANQLVAELANQSRLGQRLRLLLWGYATRVHERTMSDGHEGYEDCFHLLGHHLNFALRIRRELRIGALCSQAQERHQRPSVTRDIHG